MCIFGRNCRREAEVCSRVKFLRFSVKFRVFVFEREVGGCVCQASSRSFAAPALPLQRSGRLICQVQLLSDSSHLIMDDYSLKGLGSLCYVSLFRAYDCLAPIHDSALDSC